MSRIRGRDRKTNLRSLILGPNPLRWCDACSVPIIDRHQCGTCQGRTRPVEMTPPYDVRPGFSGDIDLVRRVIREQWGIAGLELFPEGHLVLINQAPGEDAVLEYLRGGHVVGTLLYEDQCWRFKPRGVALAYLSRPERGFLSIDADAVPFLLKRMNGLRPGIGAWSDDLRVQDQVLYLDPSGAVFGTARAKMSAAEVAGSERGVVAKTHVVRDPAQPPVDLGGPATWDTAVEANLGRLRKLEAKAARFLAKVQQRYPDLPLAAATSGGKDSAVTVRLAIEAGLRPTLMFIDTGLEFSETIQLVHDQAERFGLPLIVARAESGFFEEVKTFGPPGRDFRWCCKVLKLGPQNLAIDEHFPGGVLNLIGQRRYESDKRMERGEIWDNPWVHGQIGASPIQDWSALHVWLYLFWKQEPYNPWYERGLGRIGCYMCPAADNAELDLIRVEYPGYAKWDSALREYQEEHGLPDEWRTQNQWRWRRDGARASATPDPASTFELIEVTGISPCTLGVSTEALFVDPPRTEVFFNVLNAVGVVTPEGKDGQAVKWRGSTLHADGSMVLRGRDESTLANQKRRILEVAAMGEACTGCGICLPRCPTDAITLSPKIIIDPDACIHCGKCVPLCPVVAYGEDRRGDKGESAPA